MNRTGKVFSIAVLLFVFIFCTGDAFAAEPTPPTLNRTTTGFTIALPESRQAVKILVTSNQDGTEFMVERCLPDKPCEKLSLKDQREIYSCLPLKDGEKPGGTTVTLTNPTIGKDQPYDCQYVTATEPGEPVIFKAGENTSCPMIINGRYCDPCRNLPPFP